MTTSIMIQTKVAEKMGEYKMTNVDVKKQNADFLLKSVSPYYIKWKSGEYQMVNKRDLNKLQKNFTWETDF